ncbi:low specificity L-threonine aldolase [bacterium]|nr:low specificity L-threonine aldolase [bacterium]
MAVDLRSDTLTMPTREMRQAIAQAEVGDDVFNGDPTVLRLEELVASLLGKEAALYVPSGTMGNQLCLRALSQPGDSLIAHVGAHVLHYESGAPCALSGLQPRTIDTPDGTFSPEQVGALIAPPNIHHSRNRILALENTHNRCGGTVWPMEQFASVCAFGHEQGLVVHLDGARLWNACTASGTELSDWTQHVDTVSVCFSKGLGAPVGSALAGSRDFVERCRFFRKMFGGQMRQAGIIAAGALYALEHNRERLAEDHANARLLAEIIGEADGLACIPPQSNIVMIDVTAEGISAQQVVEAVAEEATVLAIGPRRIRAVTHLDVSQEECKLAGEAITRAMESLRTAVAT